MRQVADFHSTGGINTCVWVIIDCFTEFCPKYFAIVIPTTAPSMKHELYVSVTTTLSTSYYYYYYYYVNFTAMNVRDVTIRNIGIAWCEMLTD